MTTVRRHGVGLHLCDICADLIRSGGIELSDQRVVCPRCHRTGLHTAEEIEAIRLKVLQTMKSFGMELKKPAPLQVVDATNMAVHSGHPWIPTPHHDARPMGAYGLRRNGEVLLVESGQPPEMLTWTLAHESAHDWHADNNPIFRLLDEEIQEGFAQWAADEVAHRLGYTQVAKRQLSRRDVYGLAPKKFLRLEFVGGNDEVLAFARTIGWGRMGRLSERMSRAGESAVASELQGRYGRWQRARDLTADAELLRRKGHVFASALCLGLALKSMPLNPKLWWHWLRCHGRNFWLLLTLCAGTPLAQLCAWLPFLAMTTLLAFWLSAR